MSTYVYICFLAIVLTLLFSPRSAMETAYVHCSVVVLYPKAPSNKKYDILGVTVYCTVIGFLLVAVGFISGGTQGLVGRRWTAEQGKTISKLACFNFLDFS